MSGFTNEFTTRHVYIPIASAEAKSDDELTEMFGGSAESIRNILSAMKARGMEVVPSVGCDNQDAKGYCLGHPAKPEPPKVETEKPRDLVALAAKAMGHKIKPYAFRPFDNSGVALELACHLSMTIDYVDDGMRHHVTVRARANGRHYICTQAYQPETKLSLTLYAITYVAACIGEDMP